MYIFLPKDKALQILSDIGANVAFETLSLFLLCCWELLLISPNCIHQTFDSYSPCVPGTVLGVGIQQ